MPIEIKVGTTGLTISQDRTFMVTDERGEIEPASEQGVFAGDTRFVSFYKLYINEERWNLLTSSPVSYYAARLHFANPPISTEDGEIGTNQVGLTVTRTVGDGIHEDLDLVSFADHQVRFQLQVALLSDFADLFEVKGHRFVRRGRTTTRWYPSRAQLVTSYSNRDFHRRFIYRLLNCDSEPDYANGRVVFEVTLSPGESWHACAHYVLVEGGRARQPLYTCHAIANTGDTAMDRLQTDWRAMATRLNSSNEHVYRAYTQSVEDMGALRLYDEDFAPDVWLPAAGVPWFVTIFGRDTLIVSMQNMLIYPALARGALAKLAEYQATEFDDWRDAEPGKIPHELRVGELAHFHKIPHTPYYGTADATILYLIVLHEAWKWIGDTALLREHRQTALRCLEWIDHCGDVDGDGFQEYRSRSPQGYEDVGWKDAGDAIVYPDGRMVRQPKALCELQGYVFDAKRRMAEVFDVLGEPKRAERLRADAAELKRRFDQAFWCEDIGFYAFCLDPEKQPVKTIASNAGHCLWSGIALPERAERVVRRLMQDDMFSGWGIRTLTSLNPSYNPFSYQRGSVWPHDNGIIALGFKRYGFSEEANRVARDIFEAARYHASYRLPELYSGLPRRTTSYPVQYAGANIPQAWAAGSIFHLVQAILGLRGDAPAGKLYVAPTLPRWLPDLELCGLRIGQARVSLRFWREEDVSRWEVIEQDGPIEIVEQAWAPEAPATTGAPG
ncbi:MAG TPA: glycogen debranching N-terminal domain-containing protein [Chloroflexota bacterium]|nr:glycogen debranching N-terminal domain-containing protein [Chloroflexota bacterium]